MVFDSYAVKEVTAGSISSKAEFGSDGFLQFVDFCFKKWYEVLDGSELEVDVIDRTLDRIRSRWKLASSEHERRTAGSAFGLISIQSIRGIVHVVPKDSFSSETTDCSQRMEMCNDLCKNTFDGREDFYFYRHFRFSSDHTTFQIGECRQSSPDRTKTQRNI